MNLKKLQNEMQKLEETKNELQSKINDCNNNYKEICKEVEVLIKWHKNI